MLGPTSLAVSMRTTGLTIFGVTTFLPTAHSHAMVLQTLTGEEMLEDLAVAGESPCQRQESHPPSGNLQRCRWRLYGSCLVSSFDAQEKST